jgi:hypothetical protein
MKRFLVLLAVLVLLTSCRSNNSPTSGSSNGGLVLTGPLISGVLTDQSGVQDGYVYIVDANQNPVTSAGVTLSCSAAPNVPLAFQFSISNDVTLNYADNPPNGQLLALLNTAVYRASVPITFTPGQPVSLTAAFGGKTYNSVIQSAVGEVTFTPSSSGVSAVWVGGNNTSEVWDQDTLSPFSSQIDGMGSLSSPFFIPASFPGGDNNCWANVFNVSGFGPEADHYSTFASLSGAGTIF